MLTITLHSRDSLNICNNTFVDNELRRRNQLSKRKKDAKRVVQLKGRKRYRGGKGIKVLLNDLDKLNFIAEYF